MKRKGDAVDWLLDEVDIGLGMKHDMSNEEVRDVLHRLCPLDKQLDSPCPRWVLNILRCKMLDSHNKMRLIFRHHETISGQRIVAKIMRKFQGREIKQ